MMQAGLRAIVQIWRAFCNGRSFLPIGAVLYGAWPVALWMISFKQVKWIPHSWRPPIHLDRLPRWNAWLVSPTCVFLLTLAASPCCHYLLRRADQQKQQWSVKAVGKARLAAVLLFVYPAALSLLDLLATTEISVPKDIFAFVFYGVLHFAAPFVAPFLFWGFAPPGVASTYGWSLGFQNLASLATHIVFPNAAPWYADLGNPPPSYETSLGSPAGLARIDEIFGIDLYSKNFKLGPVVFGALPSVHTSSAICLALFAGRYFGNTATAFAVFYAVAMIWSTIYLRHHYVIDALAGSIYALAFFLLFRHTCLQHLDARAESQGLTNGYERLFLGFGPTKPHVLPYAQYRPLTDITEEELKSPLHHENKH